VNFDFSLIFGQKHISATLWCQAWICGGHD
jgi:hypothetical protein